MTSTKLTALDLLREEVGVLRRQIQALEPIAQALDLERVSAERTLNAAVAAGVAPHVAARATRNVDDWAERARRNIKSAIVSYERALSWMERLDGEIHDQP